MADTIKTNSLPERRGTRAVKWELARPDEIPLWVADMDFPVASGIVEALHRRVHHPIFGYSAVPEGYLDAFVRWQNRRNGWNVDPDHLVIIPSVMEGVALAIESLTRAGDAVGVFSPVYFPFYDAIEKLGRRAIRLPLAIDRNTFDGAPRYTFDFDVVRSEVHTLSAILLCSPHNPGGRVWDADELCQLQDIAEAAGVPVVSDEIHSDLIFPGSTFVPWLRTRNSRRTRDTRDIAFLAPSKTFNIPGLPTAFAVIPDSDVRRVITETLLARMHKMSNLLTMEAAYTAYTTAEPWLDALRPVLKERYDMVRDVLTAEEGVSVFAMEGTFIAWIDFRRRWGLVPEDRFPAGVGRSFPDTPLSQKFGIHARKHGVWLSEGSLFGPEGDGFMRLNFATSEERLMEGLNRVSRSLAGFVPE